jgi:methionyl-tRNA formyltransferase
LSKVVLCAVGLKGFKVLDSLISRGVRVDRVCSYRQADDLSGSLLEIKRLTKSTDCRFEENRRPTFGTSDLVLFVGWQFLVSVDGATKYIVFHDSLLPRYRGFSPTVAALIAGEDRIGVTAIIATAGVDEGPIVAQDSFAVVYPLKIADALARQAFLMVPLAEQIINQWRSTGGYLASREQDHSLATYNVWRDDEDYLIDWNGSADEIVRMIDAVGFPYDGARTHFEGGEIIVDDALALGDLPFVRRAPGKIWQLSEGKPVIICGKGLLRLENARRPSGEPVRFSRARGRFY